MVRLPTGRTFLGRTINLGDPKLSVLLMLAPSALAQSFSTSGDCPGNATISATISPSATGQLYTGTGPGADAIVGGPCAGVSSGLAAPTARGPATAADGYGNFTLAPNLPTVGCGMNAQVLDQSTCTMTVVGNLPAQNWFKVGSYAINDGPACADNPPTESGISGCALVFGGVSTEYHGSTSGKKVTYSSLLDGWGDSQYCTNDQPEDWKKSDFYDCGAGGCSYSAYVTDHGCTQLNYCYHQ